MSISRFRLDSSWAALLCVAAAALTAPAARADTLYQALGSQPGLTCIVDRMFDLNLADPRIRDKFDDINVERLKQRIVDHLCTLSEGPCQFRGVSMKGAHDYLQLHEVHFNALVENMEQAMDGCGVGFRTQNRLLAVLAPMEREIVSK